MGKVSWQSVVWLTRACVTNKQTRFGIHKITNIKVNGMWYQQWHLASTQDYLIQVRTYLKVRDICHRFLKHFAQLDWKSFQFLLCSNPKYEGIPFCTIILDSYTLIILCMRYLKLLQLDIIQHDLIYSETKSSVEALVSLIYSVLVILKYTAWLLNNIIFEYTA